MTNLHQQITPGDFAPTATIDRRDDPAYRRRQLARRLRPYAQLAAFLTMGFAWTAAIWLFFVLIAALPIGN